MNKIEAKPFYKATNDIVFKAVFLLPNNWSLVKRLIEDATKLTDIEIVSVVSPELPKDNIYNKGKTLDVVVKTKDRIFSIEVNVYDEIIFHRRNFAYIASQYANDLNAGDDYEVMKDHIQINISVSRSSEIPAYDIYEIRGRNHHKLFINNFTIYEFNLPKLIDSCYNDFRFLQSLYYDEEELVEKSKGDKDMEKLQKEVERVNSNEDFIQLMSAEEEERKYLNTIKKLEYNSGVEQNTKDIALKMLESKLDIDMISKITGLTKEEVEKLKNE